MHGQIDVTKCGLAFALDVGRELTLVNVPVFVQTFKLFH